MTIKLTVVAALVIGVAFSLIMQSAMARKSPDYKAGFEAGQAAETQDEKCTLAVSPDRHPCNNSPDYCAGFRAGYEKEAAASFG